MIALVSLLQALAVAPPPSASPLRADSAEHRALCWRPQPGPRCTWFLVTEVGVSRALGVEYGDFFESRFDGELGLMANVNRRSAVGGALGYTGRDASGPPSERFAFTARYRRWFSSSVALEVAGGPVAHCERGGSKDCRDGSYWGFQLQGSAHLWGLIAASATFEHLGAVPQPDRWYVGIKFGGYAAPIAALAAGMILCSEMCGWSL